MKMPQWIDESCDKIDSAIFSGDTFYDKEVIEELENYMERWQREIDNIKSVLGIVEIK